MNALRGIYGIVDDASVEAPLPFLVALLRGGVRIVQYRAKGGVDRPLLRAMLAQTRSSGAKLIVNDDLEAALEADGWHAGQEDLRGMDLPQVRRRLADRIFGISAAVRDEARAAEAAGADYVGVGPFAATGSKIDAGEAIGAPGIAAVATATALPVVAIGGIDLDALPTLVEAGASMAAVISAFARASDVEATARRFIERWRAARALSAPVVCSIGTTDPWNAAGLGLDIRVLAECDTYPVTVTAGVTAQDRTGVSSQLALPVDLVLAQLAALDDASIAGYRVGALLDVATVEAVADYLSRRAAFVVYDPALSASGGGRFGSDDVVRAIVKRLLPVVTIVTPNLAEAATLAGQPTCDVATMEGAARALVALGAAAALVKGGHLPGRCVDVLVDERGMHAYEDPRLPGSLRGTGCLLAAALAAALAHGVPLRDAIVRARAFVREKLARPQRRGDMPVAY